MGAGGGGGGGEGVRLWRTAAGGGVVWRVGGSEASGAGTVGAAGGGELGWKLAGERSWVRHRDRLAERSKAARRLRLERLGSRFGFDGRGLTRRERGRRPGWWARRLSRRDGERHRGGRGLLTEGRERRALGRHAEILGDRVGEQHIRCFTPAAAAKGSSAFTRRMRASSGSKCARRRPIISSAVTARLAGLGSSPRRTASRTDSSRLGPEHVNRGEVRLGHRAEHLHLGQRAPGWPCAARAAPRARASPRRRPCGPSPARPSPARAPCSRTCP